MKRRTFLAATTIVTAITRPAVANDRLVGWISPESAETTAPFTKAFLAGLAKQRATGVRVIERYAPGAPDDIVARQVEELQQQGVRLIVAQGAATPPVMRAKPKVPVVFAFSGDPVQAGFAQSIARPGGNATGLTFLSVELMPKRIDLLRQAVPGCKRIALISNARHPGEENEIAACRTLVEKAGLTLSVHKADNAAGLKPALAEALGSEAQAVLVLPSSLMVRNAPLLASGCIERKVPLISGWSDMARSGALLTYGPNLERAYERIANYAVRILNGTSPEVLPIEQPTEFELAINRKTAAALGITLPPSLLAQANELFD
jgi:putative ABC transport system substrate-binding protein